MDVEDLFIEDTDYPVSVSDFNKALKICFGKTTKGNRTPVTNDIFTKTDRLEFITQRLFWFSPFENVIGQVLNQNRYEFRLILNPKYKDQEKYIEQVEFFRTKCDAELNITNLSIEYHKIRLSLKVSQYIPPKLEPSLIETVCL